VTGIEYRLLGPLEVHHRGRQLDVRGGKPRALLAMLLLHAGEVVSTDRLIEALWGERPPANASNALQAHVAALRRQLNPKRADGMTDSGVLTRPSGYLLRMEGNNLDVAQFERLVAEGREALEEDPAAAVGLLRQGLSLWRGPALADFAFEPFARVDAERLEELRLAALEYRLEAELALGRHVEAVPELEALVAAYPLRERLAAQFMLALYRGGRQAEATQVFHETRSRLVEELGIEPGPALRVLLQRILEQDPALELASPPLAADEGARHNLPAERTTFVGRELELEEVSALLRAARVLTLTGAGGSGKTRLALRAARLMVDECAGGVWLVELGPLADPALVATSVAAAVGVRERSGGVVEALKRRLRDSDLLLVLDNCEHLIDACAALGGELLSGCERLRILATSREPLRIVGEVTWPVPTLELPDRPSSSGLQELQGYAAVRLFAERAAAARPGFRLCADNAEAVALLCRRLDGIPLAIELAAAKTRALAPAEILQRLGDRFRLLTGGVRDSLPRQQTLRATLDWSHDLLHANERTLFRRLSVFAGSWRAYDAEQVCADGKLPTDVIVDALCELVVKSLVVPEPSEGGVTRYRMLETLREYAAERLAESNETETFHRRHLGHFLELAEAARKERQTRGLTAELQTIAAHQDNIRAALEFAQVTDPPALLHLAAAAEVLWLAGNIVEGQRWLQTALANAGERTRARVRALNVAAALTTFRQEHERAGELVAESLDLACALGDQEGEAWARLWMGFIGLTSDPPRSTEARHSLAMHEELGDRLGICHSLLFLGIALSQFPDTRAEGDDMLKRAQRMACELEDDWGESFARTFLGWAALERGHHELAEEHLRCGVRTEALGPVRGRAMDYLAKLALERGDPIRAVRLLATSDALRERSGGRPPKWLLRRSERIRREAQGELTPLDAEQAYAEGLAMTTEQAVAYALGGPAPNDARERRQLWFTPERSAH
jgi:predicted ATPase/DNA-binding SARP family transcriptional activator